MRSDRLKYWLESSDKLPAMGTEAWNELTNEDRMIVSCLQDLNNKPNGAMFNAIMGNRYGSLKAGDGEEVTGAEGQYFDAGFNLED